ncbi:MAG: NDP-sugar synthase [Spirochaetes bacterium]|nr:NDP-sugar synthase [Spirochaetota bacterium]
MKPVTDYIPKPLVPVLNVPAICYSIMLLKEAGIREVACNLHHLPRQIESFLEDNGLFGLDLRFSYEEKILGTGGGLMNFRDFFDGEFVMLNSDLVCDIRLVDVIGAFKRSGSPGLVAVRRCAGSETATVSAAGNRVADFRDSLGTGTRPEFDYTGIAVLSPLIFDYLSRDFSSVVYTGLTGLVKNHSLACYEHVGGWYDIGTPGDYLKANLGLLKDPALSGRIAASTGFSPVPVSPGAVIDDTASVFNSVVADGCRIGKGARVEDSVIISGSDIGDGSEIRNSVVFRNGIIK